MLECAYHLRQKQHCETATLCDSQPLWLYNRFPGNMQVKAANSTPITDKRKRSNAGFFLFFFELPLDSCQEQTHTWVRSMTSPNNTTVLLRWKWRGIVDHWAAAYSALNSQVVKPLWKQLEAHCTIVWGCVHISQPFSMGQRVCPRSTILANVLLCGCSQGLFCSSCLQVITGKPTFASTKIFHEAAYDILLGPCQMNVHWSLVCSFVCVL